MGTSLDILAVALWVLAALSPILVFLFLGNRFKNMQWPQKLLLALLIGGVIGFILFWIGLSIAFRNGIRLF